METKDIIILVACLMAVGFSLYKKYKQKTDGDKMKSTGTGPASQFQSQSKDDDYEPYSGSKK
jgi:uncharacterized membrane protein YebE (DUF533 family)